MQTWLKMCSIVTLVITLSSVIPVSGALFTVPQGGKVFIGEQGLDLTQTGATTSSNIGWFEVGSNVTSGVPAVTTSVDDVKNFYIAPAVFSGRTGPWYTLPDRKLAFYVEDPSLNLRILDETTNVELSGSNTWVPKGDQVGFRVETNLIAIANRPGVSMMPITIHVIQPDGNELSGVSGYPLIDIMINSSPFSTGPVWDTGPYPSGNYMVFADCNVNNIKDNYPVVGKTETPQTGNVQILSTNPLITSSLTRTPTGVTGTTSPAPVTTVPVTTATPSMVQTTGQPPTLITTTQTSPPPTTTKAPGPDIILICCGLGVVALVTRFKDLQ